MLVGGNRSEDDVTPRVRRSRAMMSVMEQTVDSIGGCTTAASRNVGGRLQPRQTSDDLVNQTKCCNEVVSAGGLLLLQC